MGTVEDRIISSDDHLDLNAFPPSLFAERVSAKYQGRVPKVVDDKEQGKIWVVNGQFVDLSGRRKETQVSKEELGYRPGIASNRLEDMDRDGVYAQVIYGPVGGLKFLADLEVKLACQRAYNQFVSEFNSTSPNRLVALAMLPGHSPEAAKAELLMAAKLGLRGAVLPIYESKGQPVFYPEWEDFWATVNELEMPLHFHLGGGNSLLEARRGSWEFAAYVSVIPLQLDEPLAAMIFSGIFERYPKVKLVLGEAGLGWLPYFIHRMDHEWSKYNAKVKDVPLSRRPSEIFRDHIFATYEEDEIGLAFLDVIGTNNVMWASDYPHGDSTWPNSRQSIEASHIAKLTTEVRRNLLYNTAARLYKIQ